jgi:phage-related baseplate assembly protein
LQAAGWYASVLLRSAAGNVGDHMATDDLISSLASRFTVIRPELLGRMASLEDLNSEAILLSRMTRFVELWNEHDPPSAASYDVAGLEFDPIKINQECNTYHELLLRNRVNQAIRSITLAFGTGTDLDAIATRYPYGMPRQEGEDYTLQGDDRYRRRIWLSPNILTPHGVAESYIFWAMSSNVLYRDAGALTKEATGNIYIPVMLNDGTEPERRLIVVPGRLAATLVYARNYTPTQAQRLATHKYINQSGRKGLTDVVHIMAPKVTHLSIEADLWTYPGVDPASVMVDVRDAIADLVEARRWLGNDFTIMDIEKNLAQEGVYNIELKSPTVDVKVGMDGVIMVDDVLITYQGIGE